MRKLKNERGESILMALLLLLLASVISALILTAATSAAHHLRNDRKAQQNYLTVSSAAELIRDSVLNEQFQRVYEKTSTYTKENGSWQVETVTINLQPGEFTGIMKEWLEAGVQDNNDENAEYAEVSGSQDTIKIDVPVEGEDGLQTVQAEFTMDKDANITVKLSLLQPEKQNTTTDGTKSDDAADDCRMTLTITGSVAKEDRSPMTEMGEDGKKIEKYVTTIKWNTAKITKGIKEADSEKAEG